MWESPGTSRSQALGDMQASDHIQTRSHSYSHHTQSQACMRQNMLNTQLPRVPMWEEVFLGRQGPVLGIRRTGSRSWSLLCL